jgi:hypothetical protein
MANFMVNCNIAFERFWWVAFDLCLMPVFVARGEIGQYHHRQRVEDISMKLRTSALQYLARNDFYFVQPLATAEQFLTFCTNREMQASIGQLERLDRTGFFRPMARFNRQRATVKLEQTANGLRELGPLHSGEM